MDLSGLLQWWDEWQLSVLVLGSLGVKCFLAVAAGARRSYIDPVYRSLIWLCYLGGDALAIYALAALLNIQKKVAQESLAAAADSRALQLLWAPIMLMHLGGLANISAYNIEDNELWKRHIATSVSQVAVAVYVFCKLWSSTADKRLLAAAILLFIPAVFKCFEKPLALRRSSYYNLVSQPKPNKKKSSSAEEPSLEDCITKAKAASGEAEVVYDLKSTAGSECLEALSRPDKLFVDLPRTYSECAVDSESFWLLKDGTDQEVIGTSISNTFNLLYTKDFTKAREARSENPLDLLCSLFTWIFCLLVPIAAIGLLHSGRKEAYRGSDVKITFVLLYGTLLVDACSIFSLEVSPWHGMVSQHNLMALFDHNRRHPWVTAVAGHLGCTDLLGQHPFFSMKPCHSSPPTQQQCCGITSASSEKASGITSASSEKVSGITSASSEKASGITSAVRSHIRDGLKQYITDADSYRSFSDMRGQWTLKPKCKESLVLERPFDEAVLVWHLATDLYWWSSLSPDDPDAKLATPSLSPDDPDAKLATSSLSPDGDAKLATHISNYMMHLLYVNPEMLLPGSRTYLCTAAYRGIEAIFYEEDQKMENKKKQKGAAVVADRLLGFLNNHPELQAKKAENADLISWEQEEGKRLVYTAWNIVGELHKLADDDAGVGKKAWTVIRGVWVEMLCFSAIRCRGYLHAKSLGSGGEYLTFVWLLMAYAGLETYPERQQRTRTPPQPSESAAAAAKLADEEPGASAAHQSTDRKN